MIFETQANTSVFQSNRQYNFHCLATSSGFIKIEEHTLSITGLTHFLWGEKKKKGDLQPKIKF